MSDTDETTRPVPHSAQPPCLAELVDVALLQQIQDTFSDLSGLSVVIRDPEGEPVTRPSGSNDFCGAVLSTEEGAARCKRSHQVAAQQWRRQGRAFKYVCHAGLSQFAAPITVEGRKVGMIVIGDRPEGPLDPDSLRQLANDAGLDPEDLLAKAAGLKQWSETEARRSVRFIQIIANTVASLCYHRYSVRQRLQEITSLYDISRTLASTLELPRILDFIARTGTEMLGAKGCSIRLLDRRSEELVVKSWFNLSRRYRDKGPVRLEHSANDQAAMRGEIVEIRDMQTDPRVLYPAEAAEEGIKSGVVVGLVSKERPIGALHVYFSEERSFDDHDRQLLRSLAAMAAVAIENAQLYRDSLELKSVEAEMEMAARIQRRLLPSKPPEPPGYQIAAVGVPSRQVGGDLYEFVDLGDGRWAVAIADVVGKGVPAALLMATTRAMLISRAGPEVAPADLMTRLNRLVSQDVEPDQFVTLLYAVLDPVWHTLAYANAGHCRPMLFREGRFAAEFAQAGLVLGADERETYETETESLAPGDVVLLSTDGLTEAVNRREKLFGAARLRRAVERHADKSAVQILRGVRDALRGFTLGAPQSDDYTAIVIKRVS